MTPLAHGFWSQGRRQRIEALTDEEGTRLEPLLRAERTESDPDARRQIAAKIGAVRAEYEAKREAARGSLFAAN